jgi:hypothetical protein
MKAYHMIRILLATRDQFLDKRVLLLRRSKRDSLIIAGPGTLEGEERSFKSGRAVWGRWSFAFRIRQVERASVLLAPALCREGLSLVYCKRGRVSHLTRLPTDSRIGRRRGPAQAALFPRPSPERRMHVSKHGALQCCCPFPVRRLPVAALRISRTTLGASSPHLLGFPLRPVLLASPLRA